MPRKHLGSLDAPCNCSSARVSRCCACGADDHEFVSLVGKHNFTVAHLGLLLGLLHDNLQGARHRLPPVMSSHIGQLWNNKSFHFCQGLNAQCLAANALRRLRMVLCTIPAPAA